MVGPCANNGISVAKRSVAGGRYKRPFDLGMLMVIGVAFAPAWVVLWVAIPAAIWLEDRSRAFHVQRRVGRGGRPFDIIKFRTMVEDAERDTGPIWARKADSRLTRVGRVLRRLHLDEIPQVINVAKGDMSLVGPRPERPELVARITDELPEFEERLAVRPGIAGLAQLQGAYHTSPRSKLRYDKLYIAEMGPWLDLKLLTLCAWKALRAIYRHE